MEGGTEVGKDWKKIYIITEEGPSCQDQEQFD